MASIAIVIAGEACEGSARYCPVSKLHCAPPPACCMISLGSIVQRNLEMLSMLEPAAPSEGMPAAAIVAPTSLASRPVLGHESPSRSRAKVHRDAIADRAVQHHRGEPAAVLAHRT